MNEELLAALMVEACEEQTGADVSITRDSQIMLELLYSKYQLHHCIAEYFREMDAEQCLEEIEIPVSFGIDLLVQMALHKRVDIATLTGLLMKHFDTPQECVDMLDKACDADLMDWDNISRTMVVRWDIPDELQAKLDQFQYPLPMIEEPQKVTNNRQTGYRTIKSSLLLRNNHHDEDICLDHINRVNAIALAVNPDVVAYCQNRWRNHDKPKPGERREKYLARKRAFEKFDKASRDVLAGLIAQGNRFWLTHRYDKRGRTYVAGYHVSYQSSDWCKACVELADKEVCK